VVVVCVKPVPTFLTWTLASAMDAPEASVTVPWTVAVATCADKKFTFALPEMISNAIETQAVCA